MGGRAGDDVDHGPAVSHPPGPLGRPRPDFTALQAAVTTGHPCPLYVGDRWLPRHVVLAVAPLDQGIQVYNPARGTLAELTGESFESGALTVFGRWVRAWFEVRPAGTG